jgi:hypothetical protein
MLYLDEHLIFTDGKELLMLKLINIRGIHTDVSCVP